MTDNSTIPNSDDEAGNETASTPGAGTRKFGGAHFASAASAQSATSAEPNEPQAASEGEAPADIAGASPTVSSFIPDDGVQWPELPSYDDDEDWEDVEGDDLEADEPEDDGAEPSETEVEEANEDEAKDSKSSHESTTKDETDAKTDVEGEPDSSADEAGSPVVEPSSEAEAPVEANTDVASEAAPGAADATAGEPSEAQLESEPAADPEDTKPSLGERLSDGLHGFGEKLAASVRSFRMPTGEQLVGHVADAICHPGTMLWLLPFTALCWALYTLTYNGMLICSNEDVTPLATAIGVGLAVALFREPILGVLDALTARGGSCSRLGGLTAEAWRSLAGLVVCTICGIIAVETPWNEAAGDIATSYFLIDFVVIFCVLVALFFLGQRTGWLVAVGLVACFALGIGQTFVIEFKGTALLPADLMALSTAAEVSSSYTYNVTTPMLGAALALAIGLIFCCLMRPCTPAPRRVWFLRPVANLAIAAACFMGIQGAFYNVSLQEDFEISTDIWWPINSYTSGGFLPHFLNLFQKMQIGTPQGYSEETALAYEDELASVWQASQGESRAAAEAQFSEIQPSVICVMNETFSDLSLLNGLDVDYTGPAYFNSISDALVRGSLEVSAYGGGTCNSEFEFMTGNSLGYIGSGNYPYTYYDLSNVQNLAAQFSELGYDTTAIHPNAATNWNRDEVYAGFGFNRFLSIDDFEGAPGYHSGCTDASTYQKILDQLASSDQPQFVLDVTMQNHSGYDQYNIPEEDMLDYEFDFDPDDTALTHELNEYLSCINASDRDLEWFMNELRNLDRPVVLVFFGDHQPGMAGNVNDALFTNEDEITHGARSYRTNYIVWTNYYVEGSGEMRWEDASSSTLGALALQHVGAPLTTYQQAALGARMSMPMINMFAFKDNDGSWYSVADATPSEKTKSSGSSGDDDEEEEQTSTVTFATEAGQAAADVCRKLQNVQYLEFATKVM